MTNLTDSMRAALDMLTAHGDAALVRTWSQWWVPESVHAMGWDPQPAEVVTTATVHALAKRKLLKFTGSKRRVLSGANRKDFWRAELTAAGLALIAQQADAAAVAAQQLLQKVATPTR